MRKRETASHPGLCHMKPYVLVSALIFASLTALPIPAHSAKISISKVTGDDQYGELHLKLEGRITKGDLDRLKAIGDDPSLKTFKPHQSHTVLHLNSDGGNLKEGLNIVDHIIGGSVSTVLDANARCFSACALIFMAGNYVYRDVHIRRSMHVTASLGFHAPYVRVETDFGYNKAIRQLARMFKLFDKQGYSADAKPLMRQSLQLALLSKGPDEELNIDTIDKAGKWDIELFGYRQPGKITRQHLWSACVNALAWRYEVESLEQRAAHLDDTATIHLSQHQTDNFDGTFSPTVRARIRIAGFQANGLLEDHGCDVSYRNWTEFGVGVAVWRRNQPPEFDPVGYGPLWSLYPGTTKLATLAK